MNWVKMISMTFSIMFKMQNEDVSRAMYEARDLESLLLKSIHNLAQVLMEIHKGVIIMVKLVLLQLMKEELMLFMEVIEDLMPVSVFDKMII